MIPSPKSFFEEVRAAYASLAASLGLTGPIETELVCPASRYTGAGVTYTVLLDWREGMMDCQAAIELESVHLTVDVEALAIAVGVVEARGRISHSARNLKQCRKSLEGHAEYVGRVHPLLSDSDRAADLMRRAGAREWTKDG